MSKINVQTVEKSLSKVNLVLDTRISLMSLYATSMSYGDTKGDKHLSGGGFVRRMNQGCSLVSIE